MQKPLSENKKYIVQLGKLEEQGKLFWSAHEFFHPNEIIARLFFFFARLSKVYKSDSLRYMYTHTHICVRVRVFIC
jgi:hypothetical protein